jgi:TolB protein
MRALLPAALVTGLALAAALPADYADGAAERRITLEGAAELFRAGHVSTARTEVRITFSPDGTRMLWGAIGVTGGPGGWEILESVRTASGWSDPHVVPFDSASNDFDPSFSPDGRALYFFSNRPGGPGRDDIYVVPFDATRGRYGTARCLGPEVNSAGDEWAPVVAGDSTRLLFSSDGRGGKGRQDLFIATRTQDGAWGVAVNAGEVNTAGDDFDATFLHGDRGVVFASGKVDGDVSLFWAAAGAGRFGAREPLAAPVAGTFGSFTNGPSIALGEPGWLYFSTNRPDGAGRMDIYRIRYRWQ